MAGNKSREVGFAYEFPRAENITRISDIAHQAIADTVDGSFIYGIYPGTQFPVTFASGTATFTVGSGHALDKDGNSIRIAGAVAYSATGPATVDTQVPPQATPQSTGSVGIPTLVASDTYVLIKYLSTVDLTDVPAYVPGTIHGYSSYLDGYQVVLCASAGAAEAAITGGAIFLGIVTLNHSILYSGGGLQRQILRSGLSSEVKTGEAHSHTGYSLSVLAKRNGVEATTLGKVRVALSSNLATYTDFPLVIGTDWAEYLIDLQAFAGESVVIYLGSKDMGLDQVRWDAVRVVRSRNAHDDSADIYPVNYSFEQFTSMGSDGSGHVVGVIDGWDAATLDGTNYGWSGVFLDTSSGEPNSNYVLATESISNSAVYGAVVTHTAVTIPVTHQLDGAYALKDASVPSAKLLRGDYVSLAGDTMTGELTVKSNVRATEGGGLYGSLVTVSGVVTGASVTTAGAVTAGSVITGAVTSGVIGATGIAVDGRTPVVATMLTTNLSVTGNLGTTTLTATGNIAVGSLTTTGLVDGVDVSAHRHSGVTGDGLQLLGTGITDGCITGGTAGSGVKIAASTVTIANLAAEVVAYFMPKGTIVAYWGELSSLPTAGVYGGVAPWVVCDGTNNTPDLRGIFIRGYGEGAYGTSQGNHVFQDSAVIAHEHGFTSVNYTSIGYSSGTSTGSRNDPITGVTTTQTPVGASETRPASIAMHYIMKSF